MKRLKLICFIGVLAACYTPEYLSEPELYDFIEDESNGLSKTKKVGQVLVGVRYHPNDFLVWQELEGEEFNSSKLNEVSARYDDYAYFKMQLSVGQKDALYGLSSNQSAFNERLQTLSFRMNQFVNLTTSEKDTIPVADFYYARMFGMSASNDVLFVFNNERIEDSEWVSFNMREFGFKTGNQSFRFETQKLNNAPKLEELRP